MQRFATLFILSLLVSAPAWAQMLDRTAGDAADVIWARDIGAASITLDGVLNEAEWASAESINIKWNAPLGFPGSGQFFESNPFGLTEPTDPTDAVVSFLRKGNDLYVAVSAKDQSIGGSPNLWNFDGVFMTMIDKGGRPTDFSTIDDNFASTRREFAFSWWNRGRAQDSTATGAPLPGLPPFVYSQRFGSQYSDPDSTGIDREALDFGHTVDGVSNDDFNGGSTATPDTGYTLEFMVSVDSLGWDLNQAMARMPITIAIEDADYNWPQDVTRFVSTRVFWQGQWLNTLSQGTAFIAGDPGVTVSSGATPAYSTPEFVVVNGNNTPEPTIDGALDEAAWGGVDPQFTLKYQATPEELDAGLPGVISPYYSFYFHPDSNPVLDPTEGRIRMFYRGSKLYLGLDTDDQAVNGIDGEGGRDGFRMVIRSRDSTTSTMQARQLRFDFSIDSTGTARINNVPDEVTVGTDLVAAVSLKSGSTVADPTDIDAGYQMEVALDLAALGYPADLNGEKVWVSITFFDGDALEDDSQSYATRTWSMGERDNGASILGYFDPNALATAAEGAPSVNGLRALGTAPNPATDRTQVRFALDRTAVVTVEVFDVLGRLVQTVEAGAQTAGERAVTVGTAGLSAGAYVYRVRLDDGTNVTGRMMVVR